VRLDVLPVDHLALLLDGAPARREPLGRGHLERVAAVEREERLHEPLAVARRAEHHGAVVVLQRAGDDLARRSRVAVDHDDERHRRRDRLPGGHVRLRVALPPAHARHLLAARQEEVRDGDRLLEDAARVEAQVEMIPFAPSACTLRMARAMSSAVVSLKRSTGM
jgi:hypothetical protein